MKKLLAIALFLAACPAPAAVQVLQSTAPANPTIACGATDTAGSGAFAATADSQVYSTGEANYIVLNVYSVAGSTATVLIQTAPTSTGPWFTVAAVTDPSATGEPWSIPRTAFTRISVTRSAGTVKACLSAWMNNAKVY